MVLSIQYVEYIPNLDPNWIYASLFSSVAALCLRLGFGGNYIHISPDSLEDGHGCMDGSLDRRCEDND